MPGHWLHTASGLRTWCWLWSRDASRLVKKRWLRRDTTALVREVGQVVWGKRQRKRA